jgi:hypothetical protein
VKESARKFALSELYRAYRKAKADAFYESSHFHALAFSRYERNLHVNLRALLKTLNSDVELPVSFVGEVAFFPKSIQRPELPNGGLHFSTADVARDWMASRLAGPRIKSTFRQVIVPTVDFQIVSALWIIDVGHVYEEKLDPTCSYGNRLRRVGGELNLESVGLFSPYFHAYKKWRSGGLAQMRKQLEKGKSIHAVTMDVKSFYHSVSPWFALRPAFLRSIGVDLSAPQREFTRRFLRAIDRWYATTPDYRARPEGCLPVGLSASKILSNVLLIQFDRLIRERLQPAYYGRYVDDIFLVLNAEVTISSASEFMEWIGQRLGPVVRKEDSADGPVLRYRERFCRDSSIVFSGAKQKVFALSGDSKYGLDLINQIEFQIKKQSSEHRLLPALAHDESAMLSQALLATPDASLEADALRKADAISVRKLGFALLLRDVEAYARDLKPKEWRETRHTFYGLFERHVLSPAGFFEYFSYIFRVFGLMVACGDISAGRRFIHQFNLVLDSLERSTTAGTSDRTRFRSAVSFYAKAFAQAALQASTVRGFRFSREYVSLVRAIKRLDPKLPIRVSPESLRIASRELLLSDLGRRSYREYWLKENSKESRIPAPPKDMAVRRVLRLGLIRRFRKSLLLELNPPYWPAVAFPTRPFTLPEVTAIAPSLLSKPDGLKDALLALRGARVVAGAAPFGRENTSDQRIEFVVPNSRRAKVVSVCVTSFRTTDYQWKKAYKGAPDRTLLRYERLRELTNSILKAEVRPSYVVFPELSLPRRWAYGLAIKFAQNGISLIAGLENNNASGEYRNDALNSHTTKWPGYRAHVYFVQNKLLPAHHEGVMLENPVRALHAAKMPEALPIYVHGNHAFGVVICSDLTTISNRVHFQGAIDTLFVVEWNQDLPTFSHLVESTAHDLHGFVVQANNRFFGDSRIRGPYAKEHRRDIVRVRGGVLDYFVTALLDISGLRAFQETFSPRIYEKSKEKQTFKPLPIGFRMAGFRKDIG